MHGVGSCYKVDVADDPIWVIRSRDKPKVEMARASGRSNVEAGILFRPQLPVENQLCFDFIATLKNGRTRTKVSLGKEYKT